MTIHSSLKLSGAAGGPRNVWTRMERILALKKANQWQDGDRVVGLRKVRTAFKIKAKKSAAAEPAADGKAAAKPAAGGKAAPAKAAPAAKAPAAKK